MPIKHSLLTGADLHEPKGVANANPNTVYIANGAGSGAWAKMRSVLQGPTVDGNDSTVKYVSFPVAVRIYAVSLIMVDDLTTVEPDLSFVMKDSTGAVLGTFIFPADTSGPGTVVTATMYTPITAGSYVCFEVTGPQASSQCRVEPTLAFEII